MDVIFAPKKSNGGDESFLWSDDKLKSLWVSLLNPENVTKTCKDTELQGILLLLETVFNLFKRLKEKHESIQASYTIVQNELEVSKADFYKVSEDLKACKSSSCKHCLELEKEVTFYKKKLESNENRIKSIASILSMNNTEYSVNAPENNNAVAKAYDLMSQMLLGEEIKPRTKRIHQDSVDNNVRPHDKKKTKLSRPKGELVSEVLYSKGVKDDTGNFLSENTLVPETLQLEEISHLEPLKVSNKPFLIEKTFIPESLPVEKTIPETSDGINEMPPFHEEGNQKSVISSIETTPKKITAVETTIHSSPILGGSNKKPGYKNVLNHSSSSQEDSSNDCTLASQTIQPYLDKTAELKSPSLLSNQHGMSSNSAASEVDRIHSDTRKASMAEQEKDGNNRRTHADFWKLKPTSNVSIDSRSGSKSRSQKLKQTTLSLACFPKKQDLCTLKEFNGGLRQSKNETNLVDNINGNCDEETSLNLAIKESLNANENLCNLVRKNERAGIKDFGTNATVDDDDDFVSPSPKAIRKKLLRTARPKNLITRKNDASTSDSSLKKRQTMDETLFNPLYSSTMKDGIAGKRDSNFVQEVTEQSSAELLKELAGALEAEKPSTYETSFDKIPRKKSDSPNYKYRRDTVRKKEDRQKLQGWDCEQCRNYYAMAGVNLDSSEMKHRLNMCSRHRDKYPVISSTPPGYWDFNFPDSELSRLDTERK